MLFVKFVSVCVLHRLESLSGSSILQEDVPTGKMSVFFCLEFKRKGCNLRSIEADHKLERVLSYVPFGQAVSFWIKLSCDLAKLGEDLVYDVFKFFQTLWAHLRNIVHHNHRVYPIGFQRLLPQDVLQKLCKFMVKS